LEINAFLKNVTGKIIGIDTMSFIYAFEENKKYITIVKPLFDNIEKGKIKAVTSTITVLECLVKPFEFRDITLLSKYKMIFKNFPHFSTIPLSFEISEKAAEIRAKYKIRTPDAIQIASSLLSDATFFITNDTSLSKIENMIVVQLDNFINK
jgi:predicted nucleic acid-binding protein